MTRLLSKIVAPFAAALAFCLPASATTYSIDYTDLWLTANEAGWGVNIIQQGDTMFATLFVYGTDNSARWYSASAVKPASSGNQTLFSGTLYQTSGPYFGGPFSQNQVVTTPVGSMTFNFTTASTGTVSYVVNGVAVNKVIARNTFVANSLAGNYLGGLVAVSSNCSGGVTAGDVLVFGVATVQHPGSQQVSTVVNFVNNGGVQVVCTFGGTYSQAGKIGQLGGPWGCTFNGGNPTSGSYTISNIDATLYGWSGKFNGNDQFCTYNGNFGFVRDVH